jgi:hypothetical protein
MATDNVTWTNGVNVLGVWAHSPMTLQNMQNVPVTDMFPGNVFVVGSQQQVQEWSDAARDSCQRFHEHVKEFIKQETQRANQNLTGPSLQGTVAFVQSCHVLL